MTCSGVVLPTATSSTRLRPASGRRVAVGSEMKVRTSVKKICDKCKVIKRRRRVMVICDNPRHKQRQG